MQVDNGDYRLTAFFLTKSSIDFHPIFYPGERESKNKLNFSFFIENLLQSTGCSAKFQKRLGFYFRF